MNIDIRRATGSDLLELLTLEQAVFPPNLYHLINKRQYKYLLQKANADMATEMTNFTTRNIITQSAISMLSQANSLPQMALQLLS